MTLTIEQARKDIEREHFCDCEVCSRSAALCPGSAGSIIDELAAARVTLGAGCPNCADLRRANARLHETTAEARREFDAMAKDFVAAQKASAERVRKAEAEALLSSQYSARLIETMEEIAGPGAKARLEAMLRSEAFFDGGKPVADTAPAVHKLGPGRGGYIDLPDGRMLAIDVDSDGRARGVLIRQAEDGTLAIEGEVQGRELEDLVAGAAGVAPGMSPMLPTGTSTENWRKLTVAGEPYVALQPSAVGVRSMRTPDLEQTLMFTFDDVHILATRENAERLARMIDDALAATTPASRAQS